MYPTSRETLANSHDDQQQAERVYVVRFRASDGTVFQGSVLANVRPDQWDNLRIVRKGPNLRVGDNIKKFSVTLCEISQGASWKL